MLFKGNRSTLLAYQESDQTTFIHNLTSTTSRLQLAIPNTEELDLVSERDSPRDQQAECMDSPVVSTLLLQDKSRILNKTLKYIRMEEARTNLVTMEAR